MSREQPEIERFESSAPQETRAIAAQIGRQLNPGDLIALQGNLGAGKTVIAQGLAHGLGVDENEVVRSRRLSPLWASGVACTAQKQKDHPFDSI